MKRSLTVAEAGRIGGKSKSPKKLAAIAKNGKLGGWPKGRPRKVVAPPTL